MMKSYPRHFRKRSAFLLKITLAVLLLIAFVGCSNGGDQLEVDQAGAEAEISQLKDENEKLRTDLDDAISDLKAAEDRVKELENEFEAMQEAQAAPSPVPSAKVDLAASERTLSESLVGAWFIPKFYEKSRVDNYTIGLVFNLDGTGTQHQTFYLPSELNADNYATSDPTWEVSFSFTWSLNGDTVHTVFDSGAFIDYKFSFEQQQLLITNENGEKPGDNSTYVRDMPAIPEGFVAKSVVIGNIQAQEASLRRNFLGMWYFDITTWTFNEDGTGLLDIPEVANQPAEQREFTYSATEGGDDLLLAIDWADGGTAFFSAKMNGDGSITLGDDLKLTRLFDMSNCPISTQMIQTGLDVFTGRMFYDMLGIEE